MGRGYERITGVNEHNHDVLYTSMNLPRIIKINNCRLCLRNGTKD